MYDQPQMSVLENMIQKIIDILNTYAEIGKRDEPYIPMSDFQLVAEDIQRLLQQTHVVGSGDGFPDEDDEDYYQPEPECQICGKVDGHHRGCPEDDSPFALLERRGFD